MRLSRQCVIDCFALLAAFPLALSSLPSFAFPLPCSSIRTTFAPAHPQAKDFLTFDISLRLVPITPSMALVKTRLEADDQIRLDVIFSSVDVSATFPDYQPYAQVVGTGSMIVAPFGSLAVGKYAATTSLHAFDPAHGLTSVCSDQTTSVIVYADDGLASVVEYYDSRLGHYFITQNESEIAALDAGLFMEWERTGQSFLAYRPVQGAGAPVYRYYGLPSASLDTHLFALINSADIGFVTTRPSEWVLESADAFDLDPPYAVINDVATFGICPTGEIPVYRLWNRRPDTNHRYTTDPAIKARMVDDGWVAEGYGPDAIMMCAFTR